MSERSSIDAYLADVEALLPLSRSERTRILEEIGSHLRDAVDAHREGGASTPDAVRLALADMGAAHEVARQFAPEATATRTMRGWKRWTPLAIPGLGLAVVMVAVIGDLGRVIDSGATSGEWVVLRSNGLYAVALASCTIAAVIAIGRADRDPGWRKVAWAMSAVALLARTLGVVF